jgi:N-acetylmuramoyl-L-alanine amidase
MSLTDDIKALQRRIGAAPDGVVGAETIRKVNAALDGAKAATAAPRAPKPPQTARKITTIAVHCSATPEGKHYTAADIDRWHKAQGWQEIGYNAVVLLDGTIEPGRDEAKVPSHAAGFNANSIAICYVGGTDANSKPKDTRTPAQKASLLRWLKEKKAQYPAAKILGHRDYPGVKKACPSFAAREEYAAL